MNSPFFLSPTTTMLVQLPATLQTDSTSTSAAAQAAAAVTSAMAVNNTAVDLLRCNKVEEALQLFDYAYSRIIRNTTSTIPDNSYELHNYYYSCQSQITVTLLEMMMQVQQAQGLIQQHHQLQNLQEQIIILNNLNQLLLLRLQQQQAATENRNNNKNGLCSSSTHSENNDPSVAFSSPTIDLLNNPLTDNNSPNDFQPTRTITPPASTSATATINLFVQTTRALTSETSGSATNITTPTMRIHSVKLDESRNSNGAVCMPNDADLYRSPSNFFSVYNRAFVFNDYYPMRQQQELSSSSSPSTCSSGSNGTISCSDNSDCGVLPVQFYCYVPAVVLYNAGLIYHRMAIYDGKDSTYIKALELYSLSKLIIEQNSSHLTRLSGIVSPNPQQNNSRTRTIQLEVDTMLLALANNIGHIHSHFFQFDESRLCLEQMLAIFFFSDCKLVLTKDEYVFFYMNVLLALGRHPILAPAA